MLIFNKKYKKIKSLKSGDRINIISWCFGKECYSNVTGTIDKIKIGSNLLDCFFIFKSDGDKWIIGFNLKYFEFKII